MLISCDAIIDWAHRYADLAEEMAEKETSLERKKELERIASNCRWVPENPLATIGKLFKVFDSTRCRAKEKPIRKRNISTESIKTCILIILKIRTKVRLLPNLQRSYSLAS